MARKDLSFLSKLEAVIWEDLGTFYYTKLCFKDSKFLSIVAKTITAQNTSHMRRMGLYFTEEFWNYFHKGFFPNKQITIWGKDLGHTVFDP